MVLTATQILPALSFTLGCVAIHTLRPHADRLTTILVGLVVVLTIATLLMAIERRLAADPGELSPIGIDLSQAL